MIPNWDLPSLTIGIIIISIIAGIAIISLLFIFLKIRKKKENCVEGQSDQKTKRSFCFKHPINTTVSMTSRSNNHQRHPLSSAPITSSLDSHDIFSSLLEYPPSVIPPTSNNNSIHNLEKENDPISLSLARQSMEERAGYYRNPSRNPIPYHNHSIHSSNSNNHLVIREEEDEDLKAIQRWSQSSYHVW